MISEVLVVGIRHPKLTSGARFAADDGEAPRLLDAGERGQRHAFEHREDGGVQADAEREHRDDGERKCLVPRSARIAYRTSLTTSRRASSQRGIHTRRAASVVSVTLPNSFRAA